MVDLNTKTNTETPEIRDLKESIKDYSRTEESTYLTFPEWYTVYSYQEYGDFIEKNPPSQFPYFSSINQFWGSYCDMYGITYEGYPFNVGNHLMLSVVGTSFSVEYAVKGIYEKSIGRLIEWLSSYETEEDKYSVKIAQDYGNFILTRPWYEFPFGEKMVGIWKDTKFFGKHFIRKVERKLFLSVENGIKSVYAWIIKKGTHAVYGGPESEDYIWVENFRDKLWEEKPRIKKIREMGNMSYVIAVPHYQDFTDVMQWLARNGVRFLDISGNDEIMLTAIAQSDWDYKLTDAEQIFSMEILTQPHLKRIALKIPVKSLSTVLGELESNGAKIEHIHDY